MNDTESKVSLAESFVRDSCPLRRSFIERPEGAEEPTPLARLLRTQGEVGGKGGGLRVALLLSLIWICAKEPYSTTRIAGYWAELLGRDNPREDGARAIRDCLHELEERDLVRLSARGTRVEIALNLETSSKGDGKPYVPPYEREPYIPVPRTFWTHGLAGELSGAGVAMYLVSLAMTRHDDADFFLTGEFFEERFGISRSSKKRGLSELTKRGVLTVKSVESVDIATFRRVRRNVYTLAEPYLQPAPRDNPAGGPANAELPQRTKGTRPRREQTEPGTERRRRVGLSERDLAAILAQFEPQARKSSDGLDTDI